MCVCVSVFVSLNFIEMQLSYSEMHASEVTSL